MENGDYGIFIAETSDNNIIHHNTFIDNKIGDASQAYDDGFNNTWYDVTTNEGNWWSDWFGTPEYSIDGSATSTDPYPLGEPAVSEYASGINILILIIILGLVIIPLFPKIKKELKNK